MGQLDSSGRAYVDIPEQTIFLVDVAFHQTKEYRSWYYTPLEFNSQMLAGSMDALVSTFDMIDDIHLAEIILIAKLNQVLNLTKHFSPNSSGGSKIMPSLTKNGKLIRETSAFITEFCLFDLAGFRYVKPESSALGQFVRGMVAFGLVNATVTPVMERRIADLLSKDLGLKFAVLDYLSVHPDDSNAEARFKNLLEGLALGALLEPLFIVFRIIKSTLTRTLITRIPTRRTYKLEAEKVEVDDIKNLSTSEIRSIKALEEQIKLHEKKLYEYKQNPYLFDNKNILKNAPNEEIKQNIINGRIKHLEHEIEVFNKNINKIENRE